MTTPAEVTREHRETVARYFRFEMANVHLNEQLIAWLNTGRAVGDWSDENKLAQLVADLEASAYQRGLEAGRREGAEPFELLLRHARRNNDHLYSHGGTTSPKFELGMQNDGPAVHADTIGECADLLCEKLGLTKGDAPSEATSGFPPFGVDPEDSARLLALSQAIDDHLPWPSEEAREGGDYVVAVKHASEKLRHLTSLACDTKALLSHQEHGRPLPLDWLRRKIEEYEAWCKGDADD